MLPGRPAASASVPGQHPPCRGGCCPAAGQHPPGRMAASGLGSGGCCPSIRGSIRFGRRMLPRLLASRSRCCPASFGSRGGFIWTSWSEIAVLTSPQNTHTHDAHCAPTRPRRLRTCTLSPCLVTVPLLLLAGRSAARLPGQQPPLARTAAHPLLLLRAAPGRAKSLLLAYVATHTQMARLDGSPRKVTAARIHLPRAAPPF